jgi:hypothetical protein
MSMTVEQMTSLARSLLDADDNVSQLELKVKAAKEQARILREETIPMCMQEMGVNQMKLTTGETLTVKEDVYAQLSAESKPAAFAWLEENNFGGLIKTEVSVAFGKGELDNAQALIESLRKAKFDPVLEKNVHAQTLKAFLREQISNGTKVPLEIFGARAVFVAQVKSK